MLGKQVKEGQRLCVCLSLSHEGPHLNHPKKPAYPSPVPPGRFLSLIHVAPQPPWCNEAFYGPEIPFLEREPPWAWLMAGGWPA